MKKCERVTQHKPVYETPKVSKLDEVTAYLGSTAANCQDGSGDSLGCAAGNAATGIGCIGDGNSAIGFREEGPQRGCISAGNNPTLSN